MLPYTQWQWHHGRRGGHAVKFIVASKVLGCRKISENSLVGNFYYSPSKALTLSL